MKTRCWSRVSSEVPFFYPSVSPGKGIAPVSFPKVGGGLPHLQTSRTRPRSPSSAPSRRTDR
jgi:hypothetical protein